MATDNQSDDQQWSILRKEYQQWRETTETARFFRYLHQLRERTKEDWAQRAFEGNDFQTMMLKNAAALGEVAILDDLLKAETFEDLETHE